MAWNLNFLSIDLVSDTIHCNYIWHTGPWNTLCHCAVRGAIYIKLILIIEDGGAFSVTSSHTLIKLHRLQFQISLQRCLPRPDIYKLFWKSVLGLEDNAPHLVQPTTSAIISRAHTETEDISSFCVSVFKANRPSLHCPATTARRCDRSAEQS